jgi:hypothetical protein
MDTHRVMHRHRARTNGFSHAYIHAAAKAYADAALRNIDPQRHQSVARARHNRKKPWLSHTLLSVPLNCGPSRDFAAEQRVAIA